MAFAHVLRGFRPVVFVGVVLLVAGVPSSGVSAEVASESHCVVRVVGERPNGEFVVSPSECFATFAEALMSASGGSAVFDASLTGPGLLADENGVGATVASFSLGVHFDGFNGSGSSITVVGTSCSGGYWNTGAVWSNRVSSSWNGCYRLRHHDLPGAQGSNESTFGVGSTHNLGWMNNRTESVSYWGS